MSINEHIAESFNNAGLSDSQINSVFTGIAKLRAEEKSFNTSFENNWSAALTASECFYILINDAQRSYRKYISSLSDEGVIEQKKSTYIALYNLQKRAAQQYLEILTLIKNGFSDGAFARWRSMYELSVIASFIHKFGEDVAEKFIEASASEDRYDWAMASGVFPETKRHVTFGDILKHCDIDTEVWKENYTVANQTVHASPQGTFGRLGEREGDTSQSQRGDYGITAPAIHSANTLALISSMLFSVFPEEETMDKMALAASWLEELIDIYCDTHERLFPEDR